MTTYLTNPEDIKTWLDTYHIENYTILADGRVNVAGDVDLSANFLSVLPVKFNIVQGEFYAHSNKFSDPENLPRQCTSLDLSGNHFNSLKGFDDIHCEHLYLDDNQLTSLEGIWQGLKGKLGLNRNQLTNLAFCPPELSALIVNNNHLTSLKGCPKHIKGDLRLNNNSLKNLKYCAKQVDGIFSCSGNLLKNLQFGPQIVGKNYYFEKNPINSMQYYPQQAKKMSFTPTGWHSWKEEQEQFYDALFGTRPDPVIDSLTYVFEQHEFASYALYQALQVKLAQNSVTKKRKI